MVQWVWGISDVNSGFLAALQAPNGPPSKTDRLSDGLTNLKRGADRKRERGSEMLLFIDKASLCLDSHAFLSKTNTRAYVRAVVYRRGSWAATRMFIKTVSRKPYTNQSDSWQPNIIREGDDTRVRFVWTTNECEGRIEGEQVLSFVI